MATEWPKNRRIIGKKVPRIDGGIKATGKARYTLDINRPKMLHGVILRSPHAHAKILALDTAAVEKMPGVKGTFIIAGVGKEVFYAGDEIVALAADTEEHALDALRALAMTVKYEILDFFVNEEDSKAAKKRTVGGKGNNNLSPKSQQYSKGNVGEELGKADAMVEGTYGVDTICHQCLEPHGVIAEWDADGNLLVHASTQAT